MGVSCISVPVSLNAVVCVNVRVFLCVCVCVLVWSKPFVCLYVIAPECDLQGENDLWWPNQKTDPDSSVIVLKSGPSTIWREVRAVGQTLTACCSRRVLVVSTCSILLHP